MYLIGLFVVVESILIESSFVESILIESNFVDSILIECIEF